MDVLFLQVDTTDRFFGTSPDTVYGVLVGAMALAVIALWVAFTMQTRSYTEKLVELNVSCVETLKDLSSNLERLRDAGVNMTDDLRAEINRTREHIAEKIENLNLRYEKSKHE